MGCNAWNHPASCDCGWGGVNYGSYSVPVPQAPTGLDWAKPSVSFDSFVNPNARCPYCGDSVFFYQSPYGGRVFFDELGPPWPKHPCTDRSLERTQTVQIERALAPRYGRKIQSLRPDGWNPLAFKKRTTSGRFDVFQLDGEIPQIGSRFLILPMGQFTGLPVFWKWDAAQPEYVIVSAYSQDSHGIWKEISYESPSWLQSLHDIWPIGSDIKPSAKAYCNIGWALSFKHKKGGGKLWIQNRHVNMKSAMACFHAATKLDSWVAHNNLGVIFRDGLGTNIDENLAFHHFKIAAESMKETPMQHLANCYRDGTGVAKCEETAQIYEKYMKPMSGFKLDDEISAGLPNVSKSSRTDR